MPPKKKSKAEKKKSLKSKEISSDESEGEVKRKTTSVADKSDKVLLNKTSTEFAEQDFSNSSKTSDGQSWNLKIASWNVDGIRAWAKVMILNDTTNNNTRLNDNL